MECCTIQPPSDHKSDATRSARVAVDENGGRSSPATPPDVAFASLNSAADAKASSPPPPSDSAAVEASSGGGRRGRLRCLLRFYRGNPEALGWALDAVPRGSALMGAAVFVSTALLNLAKEAAGCETGPDAEECEGKVYGMRPTSLLTNISLVVGVVCAALMPLVGSVVDHTKYRRAVGRISGAAVSLLVLVQVFISLETWFAIAISQVFLAFSYSVHLCVALAYLPELTEDKNELMRWNASFTVAQYLSSVFFLVVIVGAVSALGYSDDSVMSARISQGVVFLLCSVFFGYAWAKLFKAREASQQIPEGSTLVSAGFRKIYRTSRIIWSQHRAIKWCLLAVSLGEAAVAAFVTIGITFMTDQLQFTSVENGITILILLVTSILGTQIATLVSNRWNPIRSLQLCLAIWIANTTIAAVVLKGPGQQVATYCFAVVWGTATGWMYPTERSLYCAIIPKGQDGELMGMYLCSCQILSWLPPLVFTAMNESGVSMRIGVASLDIFFALSFGVLFFVGSYDEAVEHGRNFVAESSQLGGSQRENEQNKIKDLGCSDMESPLSLCSGEGSIQLSSRSVPDGSEEKIINSTGHLLMSTFANEPLDGGSMFGSKSANRREHKGESEEMKEELR
mmetsp:Transcript_3029/g.7880  ORF Transcript_3029/g.7880 Transcript_3029/m.7880 type:complete len:626 (-) Transcript_3029:156-2033(-)